MTHRHWSFKLAAFALLAPIAALQAQGRAAALRGITVAELRDHIHYLASDLLEGRDAFGKGFMLAAEYGAGQFGDAGLIPMFTDSTGAPSYFQQIRSENTTNVVGLIPGTDRVLKDEYIVVTAHLDHVGVRDGVVYNGADDNASGSAAVIEAAEAAAMVPGERSIIFVLLTGEERGFIGSRYFVDQPPVSIEQIVLNINLDMVGRNSPEFPNVLLALGSENQRPRLLRLIRNVNREVRANLDWRLNEGEDPHSHLQRSDQLVFIRRGIPAILITRGFMGPDYHQPSDDPETINYGKVLQASRLAFALAVAAANGEVRFERESPPLSLLCCPGRGGGRFAARWIPATRCPSPESPSTPPGSGPTG